MYSNKTPILLLLTCFILACNPPTSIQDKDDTDINGYADETFFKVDGKEILNRQGIPVVIKGLGLGGWFMPEGYMFRMPGGYGPTAIREEITELLGASLADQWFELFRDNYVREDDIIAMKEWGVDHIRIPFHYDIFYDKNSETFIKKDLNVLIKFYLCKRHRMDVIDMHAAPGAQCRSYC